MTDTWLVKCCTIIIVTDPMLCFLRPEKSTAQFQNLLFYISSIALVLHLLFILVSSHLIWLLPTLWHWIAYNVLMCCLLGHSVILSESSAVDSTSLSVPTSNTTGRHCCGGTPPIAVYSANFPAGIPMPQAPRSPSPRILSPSVITTA